jgi:hypothetical protein
VIRSRVVLVAIDIDWEGRRQVIGVELLTGRVRPAGKIRQPPDSGSKHEVMRGVNFAISDDYPGLKARNHGSACGGLRNTASFRSKEKRPSTEANSSFSSSRKSSTASEVPSCATCSIAISKSLEPRRSRNNFATFWERANARTALSFFEEWSAQADDRGGENAKNKRPVCVFQEHKRTNCVGRLCFYYLIVSAFF